MSSLIKYICWNEPLWTQDNPTYSAITMALPGDCIGAWKKLHPDTTYTDDEALDDFIVCNWAWEIYLEDQGLKPWERTLDNLKQA